MILEFFILLTSALIYLTYSTSSHLSYIEELDTIDRHGGKPGRPPFSLKNLPEYFSGVQSIENGAGTFVFEKTYGFVEETYKIPMKKTASFPIASNTKLMVTTSLYKLQDQGKLNISAPLSQYLTKEDFENFGFPDVALPWCPKVFQGDGQCQSPTIEDLLSASSGLFDVFNCQYGGVYGFNESLKQFCPYAGDEGYFKTYGSIGEQIGTFINLPLVGVPGTQEAFHYQNEHFIMGAYLVEKFSGMSFRDFLQTYIFSKAGMKDSYYDPWEGQFKLTNEANSYYKFIRPGSSKPFATGVCPKLKSAAVVGGGGVTSTAPDMRAFYKALFVKKILVSQKALDSILTPRFSLPDYFEVLPPFGSKKPFTFKFAQGAAVGVRSNGQIGAVVWGGNIGCYNSITEIVFKNDGSDGSRKIHSDWIVSVFGTTVPITVTKKEYNAALHTKNGTFDDLKSNWLTGGATDTAKYGNKLMEYYTGLKGLV